MSALLCLSHSGRRCHCFGVWLRRCWTTVRGNSVTSRRRVCEMREEKKRGGARQGDVQMESESHFTTAFPVSLTANHPARSPSPTISNASASPLPHRTIRFHQAMEPPRAARYEILVNINLSHTLRVKVVYLQSESFQWRSSLLK